MVAVYVCGREWGCPVIPVFPATALNADRSPSLAFPHSPWVILRHYITFPHGTRQNMSFNFGICGWSKFFICSFVLAINSHSKSALKKENNFVPSVCQISPWLVYGSCSYLGQLLQLPATKILFQYTNINMTLIRYLRNQESGQKKYHLLAEPTHFGWALVLVDMCGRDIYHQLEISTFCDREWRQECFHSRN